jgi:hypothetical protein
MPSAGFEPAIPATEKLQTYVLDRTATFVGVWTKLASRKWEHRLRTRSQNQAVDTTVQCACHASIYTFRCLTNRAIQCANIYCKVTKKVDWDICIISFLPTNDD